MWCASAPMAHPASSATVVAPRRLAWTLLARSSTANPALRPRFSPFLCPSNGRHGSGSVAASALKPLTVRRQRPSLPPATTASTTPDRSHIAATANAFAPLEHALQSVRTRENGPSASPRRSPVAVNGCEIISTSDSVRCGLAWRSARSDSVSNIPPVVPPMTSPTRRPFRASPTSPACAVRLVGRLPGERARPRPVLRDTARWHELRRGEHRRAHGGALAGRRRTGSAATALGHRERAARPRARHVVARQWP